MSQLLKDLTISYIFFSCCVNISKRKTLDRRNHLADSGMRHCACRKKDMEIIQLQCVCSRLQWIFLPCRMRVTLALLAHVSVVGQMKAKVKCNPDNSQTSWPLAWKLHFSSLNEDLLLYWLMVHFCSSGQKSMYATCSPKAEGLRRWGAMPVIPLLLKPPELTHK